MEKSSKNVREAMYEMLPSERGSVYEIIQAVGEYEKVQNISSNERLTSWYGDLAEWEVKENVTIEQLTTRYNEIVNTARKKNENEIEEKTENQKMQTSESAKELIKRAENLLEDAFKNQDDFTTLLNTISKFPALTVNNSLLIAKDMPNATMFASFEGWKYHHKQSINRGAEGIKLIKPVKGVVSAVTLFDISQTSNKRNIEINKIEHDVPNRDNTHHAFFDVLREISTLPIELMELNNNSSEIKFGSYIAIDKNLPINEMNINALKRISATVLHDVLYDGNKNHIKAIFGKPTPIKEFETEILSYCLCKYYNLESDKLTIPDIEKIKGQNFDKSFEMNHIRTKFTQLVDTINSEWLPIREKYIDMNIEEIKTPEKAVEPIKAEEQPQEQVEIDEPLPLPEPEPTKPLDISDRDCADEIVIATNENFKNNSLDVKTVLNQVIPKYGLETVQKVLAFEIDANKMDGRISKDNKLWAEDNRDSVSYQSSRLNQINPGLINLIATRFIKDFYIKPSLLGRLDKKNKEINQTEQNQNVKQKGIENDRLSAN